MGDCSFNLEQYENTIEYYSKYLETADDNEKVDKGKVYFYRGVSHIQLEKYEEAVNDFSSAIELSYQPELSAFQRGLAYNTINRYKEAISDLDTTTLKITIRL